MALLFKKLYLNKEYENVYVDFDVVNINSSGTRVEAFLNYWQDSTKQLKIHGASYSLPFDKTSTDNAYTQCYKELKKLDEFSDAEDV